MTAVKKMPYRLTLAAAAALAVTQLVACGDGGDGNTGTGQLKFSVADAPVDGAIAVVVKFTGVEVKPKNGSAVQFDFSTARSVDLLATAGGAAFLLLDGVTLDAGEYESVRLKVVTSRTTTDSYIDLRDGSRAPLFVPSGSESGLKINNGFVVPVGGVRALIVDFDLSRSIVKPTGQEAYTLKPVLRLVDESSIGLIRGTVAASNITAPGCTGDANTGAGNAIYIYSGSVTTPDDLGGSGAQPFVTAPVKFDAATGTYRYTVAYLPAGSYTAAFTCQAMGDDPEANNTTVFGTPASAPVTAGATTTVNF